MAAYNGRRGPNVSQYIAGLNQLPNANELSPQDDFTIDDDLALFTNTEFFDQDSGTMMNMQQPAPFNQDVSRRQSAQGTFDAGLGSTEFLNNDFQFAGFPDFTAMGTDTALNIAAPQPNAFPMQQLTSPSASAASPATGPQNADQLNTELMSDPSKASSMDEQARMMAEEDKRRRNTAASARFRVKKKQREQQLEKTAKDMTDKVNSLESRIAQLETENKWLKNLITEKADSKTGDLAELYKQFQKGTTPDSRSTGQRTDGVGTGSKSD